MSPDLSQFRRPSDSVTPTKWRGPDGRVWERTGEKRTPKEGELHWCDTSQPNPYPFEWPPETCWNPRQDWPPPNFQITQENDEQGNRRADFLDPNARPCIYCGLRVSKHLDPLRIMGKAAAFLGDWPPPAAPEFKCPREHVCAIWKLAEDQDWDPGEVKPAGPPSIEELIQQAQFAEDPLVLARLQTLGILYQAQELQEINIQLDQLTDIAGELDLIEMHAYEALRVIKPEE